MNSPQTHSVKHYQNLTSPEIPEDNHIVFSGISLGHSMKEIANHLSNRGFQTVRVKPYQIKMSGTFCDIDDVELFINGSPLGVTKNIYLSVNSIATGSVSLSVSEASSLKPIDLR